MAKLNHWYSSRTGGADVIVQQVSETFVQVKLNYGLIRKMTREEFIESYTEITTKVAK